MEDHVHTGVISFIEIGVYAVLFIWLLRIIAAKLTEYTSTEMLGKAVGGLVHFA